MKRIIALIIALAFLLSGCATGVSQSAEKLTVVSTIFAPYDFTREITNGLVQNIMLLPPGSESHNYEPTPRDIITIQNCDVFIYVGGESDVWVENVLSSMDTSGMKIVTLMDCVAPVREEFVEGMESDEHEDEAEHEDEYDEHVWTSPQNAKLIVSKISDALSEVDAQNASAYSENTAAYLEKLDALDIAFTDVVGGAVRNTVVFGDRFPFRYLVSAYGIEYYAAFPGCSDHTEPSPKTVAFLIDKVNNEGIPVVFHAELSDERMANTICEATGAKIMLLHACHNISKDDFENGTSYLEIMTQNAAALKEALW